MIPETYLNGLIGGLIIGLAGAVYLLGSGRVMGASGILGGLVDGSAKSDWRQRLLFVVAVAIAPMIAIALTKADPSTNITSNVWVVIAAGLLVGIGTRIANGCTSGHGVCGISRLSMRGIVASVVYIFMGGVAMLLLRHVWGLI